MVQFEKALLAVMALVDKALLPELDYAVHSSVWLSNYTWNEAMHNVSVLQLPCSLVDWGFRIYQLDLYKDLLQWVSWTW